MGSAALPRLERRLTADGSFSLWSAEFGEGFHSGRGALREAAETFLEPSGLERFPAGSTLRVLEVCVGTGTNLAALLDDCGKRDLRLRWWGLELDPQPLALALADAGFRQQWQPHTLAVLDQLQGRGSWQGERGAGALLWGDARRTLRELGAREPGPIDLIWHDAFSPRRCPQLWSVQFLESLATLLAPQGRWISYSSAAAVRAGLVLAGLELAAIQAAPGRGGEGKPGLQAWSGGTVASPHISAGSAGLRPLAAMELEHLGSSAGVPYRDPLGTADAGTILANRAREQAELLGRGRVPSSSAWRRRWGLHARP